MNSIARITVAALMVAVFVCPAAADWDPTIPNTKWVQMPDTSPEGMDVHCDQPLIVADDWLCLEPSLLTDIHIWASWYQDYLPFGEDPAAVDFVLRVYDDIPAEASPTGYSMPGAMLWEYVVQGAGPEVAIQIWEDQLMEGWFDPPTGLYQWPGDTVCWQYNFYIPPEFAFIQEGRIDAPKVYWLAVEALAIDPMAQFGWKTSQDHWNDDSTWTTENTGQMWEELIHPEMGYSLDQAFALTFEPTEETNVKWVQMPDLTVEGLDVYCQEPVIVADDWECTEESALTDIHIWGSWLQDELPFGGDPYAVDFRFQIYRDIPAAQSPTGYSMPGELVWEYIAQAGADTNVMLWEDGLQEGFLNPSTGMWLFPGDTVCWQYNFYIPPCMAFIQEGSTTQPMVYWLAVEVFPHDLNTEFGWKTSADHWNDDSVWMIDGQAMMWQELIHPQYEFSLDQAFALTFSDVPIPGDGNGDGCVDIADYTVWADNYGWTGPPGGNPGDYNCDGAVDIADYTVWADNFGVGCP